MKKRLIMALLAGIPIASSTSFFASDFRHLKEIIDFLEEQERHFWGHASKASRDISDHTENVPQEAFELQQGGCQLSVSNLETKAVDVLYEQKNLQISFDTMKIEMQQASYAQQPDDKYLTINTKVEIQSTSETERGSFSSYARSMTTQSIDRELDFEKAQPKYDASKKLFTIFIPYKYKKIKTIAVEMVS